MPPVGFEHTISEDGQSQTYAFHRAATRTGGTAFLEAQNQSLHRKMNFIPHREHSVPVLLKLTGECCERKGRKAVYCQHQKEHMKITLCEQIYI